MNLNLHDAEPAVESPLISLKTITDFDAPFLLEAYAASRADEMALVPWTNEQKAAFLTMQARAQHAHYLAYYDSASFDTIKFAGQPAGRIYVARTAGQIKILDLTVLPAFRNKGIGSSVVKSLLREAAAARRDVSIYIDAGSRAERTFENLGFRVDADENHHRLWQWTAGGETNRENC